MQNRHVLRKTFMIKLHGKDQKVLIIHIMVIYGLKSVQILKSSFILHLVKMLRIHFLKNERR